MKEMAKQSSHLFFNEIMQFFYIKFYYLKKYLNMRHLNESIRLNESIDKEAGLLKVLKDAYNDGYGLTPLGLSTICDETDASQYDVWDEFYDTGDISDKEIVAAQKILVKNLGSVIINIEWEDLNKNIDMDNLEYGMYGLMKDVTSQNAEYVSTIANAVKDPSFLKAKYVGFEQNTDGKTVAYWSKTPWGDKAIKFLTVDDF